MWAFVGLVAAFGLLIAYLVYANRRRVRALEALAAEMGWSYAPADNPEVQPRHQAFELFRSGHWGMANDVMRAEVDGRAVEVFGYRWGIRYLRRNVVYHQTVVHVVDAEIAMPVFALRPADAVRQVFGTQPFGNVFLDLAPEFSMRNYVTAADPPATARCFTATVLSALSAHEGDAIDGGGPHLFLFRHNRVEKVADIPGRVRAALTLASAFAERAPTAGPPPLG